MAVSKRLRYEVLRRDGHTCRYCGGRPPEAILTVDHVVPSTLGGTDSPENLVTACRDCNAGKSSASPDAPLVAEANEDALRWSLAMRSAAEQMLSQMRNRDAVRQVFYERWTSWAVAGKPIELPADWGSTVDRFMAAGLPLDVLLDSVDIAIGNGRVRPDSAFRYMCGVAWNKVTELQLTAIARLGAAQTNEPDGDDHPAAWYDGRTEKARELLSLLANPDAWVQAARDRLTDPELGEPTSHDILDLASHWAVRGLMAEGSQAQRALQQLLDALPRNLVLRCRENAREFLLAIDPSRQPDEFSIMWKAADLAARELTESEG